MFPYEGTTVRSEKEIAIGLEANFMEKQLGVVSKTNERNLEWCAMRDGRRFHPVRTAFRLGTSKNRTGCNRIVVAAWFRGNARPVRSKEHLC